MYQNIVVGTDGSDTAAEAVRRAVAIAAATSAHLHLVSAYTPPSRAVTISPEVGYVVAHGRAGWDGEVQDAVRSMLEVLAEQATATGVKVTMHALSGDAVTALLDVAGATNADLLVVGNRGMSGVRRMVGSVPNTITHKAPCDVLVVHTT